MKVSPALQAIIGVKEATRSEVIDLIWAYIKKNNLQDPEDRQYYCPDEKFANVFGNQRIRAYEMVKFYSAHLYK